MFSRAAKSIVKTIGQRKYHAAEENIKSAVIGGAGEVGQSLSQMLKQTSKLDVLALYDVAALNKRYLTPMQIKNFKDSNTASNTANSRMLTMLEKSRSNKSAEHPQTPYFSNRVSNANQNATEELVRSLRQLPIAEECATNQFARPTMESQGNHACANDLRGARVLGEMGPATFQHSGHIVSEICRQFPDFANYFTKTRSNNDDVASTRRWYSNIALSCNVKSELDSRSPIAEFAAHFEKACARRKTEKISMTMQNSHMLEGMDNVKNRSTKKDGKQSNMTSSEQTMKKKLFKDNENRAAMQRCDRKRNEARKCNESKIIEKTMTKVEKRSSNVEKSKNWTIPAALSDKKPKMLYGLVRQRRKPLTNFFSRFFEIRNNDLANDYYSKLGGWKIDRIDCAANRKMLKESSRDKSHRKRSYGENRSNVSTSVSDLAAGSLEGTESSMIVENSRSLEQLENRRIVQQSAESSSCDIIEAVPTTSNSESEIDTSENGSTQKISSKIALFLENLKTNGQRSHSLSSLLSYNLESLFTDVQVAPILKHPTPTSILFSSSDSDCKLSIKDKLKKICGKKKSKKEDEICKKRKCKGVDAGKSCGKKIEPAACKKRDERKKRDEGKKQPTCDEDVEDPCKPCRSEEHHGPTCKKYKEETKYDPCDKLWNDETHGQRCKKQQKKKKTTTTDTCCHKKEESCDMKKKEKPKKSEKAKCPPVVRAPGCPRDDDKSGGTGRGSFRRYSTFDSKINANNDSDYKDISKTDESNDVSINSQRSRQEKTRKVGLLDSNAFDVSCRYRNENFRNC